MGKIIKENIILCILTTSFFIGIWNSFPMTGAIFDEMFVGGVLKSIEHHSLLPQGVDIPYGTVIYFITYPLVVLFLIAVLPFVHFDLSVLKVFIAENIYTVYFIPRLISIFCGTYLLFELNRFLKSINKENGTRLFLLTLLFTNILITVIFHTAKVWVLSTFFIILSFLYLYKVITSSDDNEIKLSIFFSVIFSFLAFANFPLAGFSLINIPIIYYYINKKRDHVFSLMKYLCVGVSLFTLLFLTNYSAIISQIKSIIFDYTITRDVLNYNISIAQSLFLNLEKILMCYPIFIFVFLYFLYKKQKIANHKLFVISMVYFLAYFIVVSIVARWSINSHSFLRYTFPIGFFLFFILASFDFKFNWKFGLLGSISVVYWIFTLYYLSVPNTYIEALNWINSNLNNKNIVIFNLASQEFDLPKNKESYLISDDMYCGSKCRYVIGGKINKEINYLLVNEQTKLVFKSVAGYDGKDKYFISNSKNINPNQIYVKSFTNNIDDKEIFYIDSIGSYFEKEFFSIGRLGKNIYIYKII